MKLALVLGVGAAALAAVGWAWRAPLLQRLMAGKVMEMVASGSSLAALPDGLHVGLCGAGSPLPDPQRSGPCTAVVAGQRLFVFDAGSSAARHLVTMRMNVGQVEALFLTHYHSDHIDGLGELMLQHWAQGAAKAPLPVHGPRGLEQVLGGFTQAYELDRGYRIAHHGETVVPASGFGAAAHPFELGPSGRVVLVSEPDLEIVAFAVEHEPVEPAVGYRIRYKDRSVVISGDTRACEAMVREAKGVDVLVHEALSPELVKMFGDAFAQADRPGLLKMTHDILDYHTSPEQAADIAQRAGVKALVLSHIIPLLPDGLEPVFLQRAPQIFSGRLHVGIDHDWISLPAGSTQVNIGRRE